MSKYGKLSRGDGHSKWFLQRTLKEHDKSMDHPWMQMIYGQVFSVKQYCHWLARLHKLFADLEAELDHDVLRQVHDDALLRKPGLEADLRQLLGAKWQEEVDTMVKESACAQRYAESFRADASDPELVLVHHFLQYNAVLSGGSYQGEMVSAKFSVPHGAPGVRFYHFEGVRQKQESARVQKYLRALDEVELSDESREKMLKAMRRIYAETEAIMDEVYQLDPKKGTAYNSSGTNEPPKPIPPEQQVELDLSELHGFLGVDGGRILLSIGGELLDVSAGREMYGPDGSYSILAGRDVTRCLATMSLDLEALDDLVWKPTSPEDEETLSTWKVKLKEKYPVAGKLKVQDAGVEDSQFLSQLRARKAAAKAKAAAALEALPGAEASTAAPAAEGEEEQACPISGKKGACPMSSFLPKRDAKPLETQAIPSAGDPAGFKSGKSMIAHPTVVTPTASSWEDSFLYTICPLHWDDKTLRLLVVVALLSWISGFFIGWKVKGFLSET